MTSLSWTLDHVGAMARTVADCAAMLGKMKGLRLGIPAEYFFDKVHEETEAALRRVINVLKGLSVLMLSAGNAAPKLEAEIVGTDLPTDPPAVPRPDVFNMANVTGIPAIVLPCGFTVLRCFMWVGEPA